MSFGPLFFKTSRELQDWLHEHPEPLDHDTMRDLLLAMLERMALLERKTLARTEDDES